MDGTLFSLPCARHHCTMKGLFAYFPRKNPEQGCTGPHHWGVRIRPWRRFSFFLKPGLLGVPHSARDHTWLWALVCGSCPPGGVRTSGTGQDKSSICRKGLCVGYFLQGWDAQRRGIIFQESWWASPFFQAKNLSGAEKCKLHAQGHAASGWTQVGRRFRMRRAPWLLRRPRLLLF